MQSPITTTSHLLKEVLIPESYMNLKAWVSLPAPGTEGIPFPSDVGLEVAQGAHSCMEVPETHFPPFCSSQGRWYYCPRDVVVVGDVRG